MTKRTSYLPINLLVSVHEAKKIKTEKRGNIVRL